MDILAGTGSSTPTYLANVSGKLFFAASDGTHGVELWTSDGAGGSAALVKDISASSASPGNLTNLNGTLAFTATDAAHGRELWTSDGTGPGTALAGDIVPGSGTSNPANLASADGLLCFSADDGIHGNELWKFVPLLSGDVDRDGKRTIADVWALMTCLSDLHNFQSAGGLSDDDLLAIADINGDHQVTNADIQSLINQLAVDANGGGNMISISRAGSAADTAITADAPMGSTTGSGGSADANALTSAVQPITVRSNSNEPVQPGAARSALATGLKNEVPTTFVAPAPANHSIDASQHRSSHRRRDVSSSSIDADVGNPPLSSLN
jgi:ELWxxDGT repeat protein